MALFKRTSPVKKDTQAPAAAKPVINAPHFRSTVLLAPVITEKATKNGVYTFRVSDNATRNEVMKAIKALYDKTPRKVNMLTVKGKAMRFGRSAGQRSDWKKAIVYLAKGETIDLFAK